jgi:hypothetical protein
MFFRSSNWQDEWALANVLGGCGRMSSDAKSQGAGCNAVLNQIQVGGLCVCKPGFISANPFDTTNPYCVKRVPPRLQRRLFTFAHTFTCICVCKYMLARHGLDLGH